MARFYYSVGGRYSYLASTQMAKFDSGPYDWDYRRLDAERWADYYEEPRGAVHSDPELLARACVAADTLGAVRPYSESLFSAVFVDPLPEIGTGQCVERAETLGLPREDFARGLAGDGTAARQDGRGGMPRRGLRGAHLRRRRQDLLGATIVWSCCATTLTRRPSYLTRSFRPTVRLRGEDHLGGGRRVRVSSSRRGCTIRPGPARLGRDILPMTPSSSKTGAAIKPGTVHEANPKTSAATASRRNAAAGPIE